MSRRGPRDAAHGDIEALSKLWYNGLQDAHAEILALEVARQRTLQSFRERIENGLPDVRVLDDGGGAAGFSYRQGDELYQFYVHQRARSTGAARFLMEDADRQFARAGVGTAWLACAIGNEWAVRFYEKSGWHRTGGFENVLTLPSGPFPLESGATRRLSRRN